MTSDPLIGKAERQKLGHWRSAAFAYQDKLGNVWQEADTKTARQKAWAAAQLREHFGIASLTQARRSQFRPIGAHFLTLAGRDAEAFRLLTKTGRARDSAPAGDTHEARELWIHKIRAELRAHLRRLDTPRTAADRAATAHAAEHGGAITQDYLLQILRDQHHKPRTFQDLALLPADALRRAYFTLQSRIRAREGRSSARSA